MITKPKKKETKTYLALIVIGIALVLGCPNSGGSSDPVTESVPPAGETKFPANGDIVLTYSGTVVKGTGNITIGNVEIDVTAAAEVVVVNIPAVDASTGVAGKPATTTVTINPETDLAVGETTLAVPAGAFKVDISQGSNVAGYSLDFTTIAADDTAPTATSVPADNATGIAVDANIVLTFSEPVYVGTGDITIHASNQSTVTIPVTDDEAVTVDGAVVTINPAGNLPAGQTYVLTIPRGAFTDYANSYAGTRISFATVAAN